MAGLSSTQQRAGSLVGRREFQLRVMRSEQAPWPHKAQQEKPLHGDTTILRGSRGLGLVVEAE